MENPPFWWYLYTRKDEIFMGYVSFREGTILKMMVYTRNSPIPGAPIFSWTMVQLWNFGSVTQIRWFIVATCCFLNQNPTPLLFWLDTRCSWTVFFFLLRCSSFKPQVFLWSLEMEVTLSSPLKPHKDQSLQRTCINVYSPPKTKESSPAKMLLGGRIFSFSNWFVKMAPCCNFKDNLTR